MTTHNQTLIFVVSFMMGIVCGDSLVYASEIAVMFFALGVVQVILYFFGKRGEWYSIQRGGAVSAASLYRIPLITILISFGIFLGILRTQFIAEKNVFVCHDVCEYNATIISSIEAKNQYQIFKVRNISSDEYFYDVEITTTLYPAYRVGDTLTLYGKVLPVQNIYPHLDTKYNGKHFEYVSYMHTKHVGSKMLYPKIEVTDQVPHTVTHMLMRWKDDLVRRVTMYVDSPASLLASGMLFGSSSFPKEMSDTFRVAGLSHIVVLSGFNIVIIISFIMTLLSFFPRGIRIFVSGFSIFIFVCMVGASPSVMRATLMAFISLLAMISNRVYVAKQALIISLFLSVIHNPEILLHDVSLHLSFLATAGIVYMSDPLMHFLQRTRFNSMPKFFQELFIISFSAYSSTLPYVMYTFGSVSVYALIANILVVPLVPLGMLFSLLVVLFSYLSSTLTFLFGFLDTVLLSGIVYIAEVIERLPYSNVHVHISFFGVSLMYLCMVLSVKYISVSCKDETSVTKELPMSQGVISY
ncbi:MAG: ComEC/Rec2 family competence protein [Candidatus Pacebacteria bacterium]|nr:ComEC/Rec2 family competence protein [Candidatus Paceibacterota bacterium]MBP9866991.1 ComEC/Rec2 family competence protein [Candidatus Paceibacterota bacterium]